MKENLGSAALLSGALVGGATLLLGATGCVHMIYAFQSNPLPQNAETLQVGHALYQEHCQSCHGLGGRGDGAEASQMPVPPVNLVEQSPEWSDGVFQIRLVAPAENGMPSYAETLTADERWHIISYVRSLVEQAAAD